MIRGDRFIISSQILSILSHRPEGNVAEVKNFVNGQMIVQIGDRQYLLPIEEFKNYIVKEIKAEKPRTIQTAVARVRRAPVIIERTQPKPKPVPKPEPKPKPPSDEEDYI